MAENLKFNSPARALDVPRIDRLSLAGTLDWSIVATLAFLVILGFGLRVTQLGAIGFAEDEMNKLDAIHAYERGDFTANSEHPMVMKLLMWASVRNAPMDSEEARLRLPNALVGALTVIPLFLLTLAFFDKWTALLAAAFWAVGINAITHNRIGKEDSLLIFFMLFGFYFFIRAKQIPPSDKSPRYRRFAASAVSFGLMIASKYFPHYFGLNMLFHHNFRLREPSGPTPGWFYLLIIGTFLVASPAVLLPEVWRYMDAYMGERLLTHSGYLFAGELYKNNMSSSPFWGTPIYFYLLFLALKVPLLTLIAFLGGLFVALKSPRKLGHAFLLFMFLFWIVPYSLIGGKWLRYTLTVMPFVYMLAAVGVVALVRWTSKRFTDSRHRASFAVSAVAVVVFVCFPAWTAFANRPHYALYTNALAADKAGYYFPHDEFYDDGLREAIKFVCESAPQGATIAHETPGVVRHYLSVFNRPDLNSKTVSSREFDVTAASGPVYVIVQNGRTYFENREEFAAVRGKFSRVHEVKIRGVTAAEVFRKR